MKHYTELNLIGRTEYRIEFSKHLQHIMTYKRINQVDLCKNIGIPYRILDDYINGDRMPTIYELYKLANVLECSIEDLLP